MFKLLYVTKHYFLKILFQKRGCCLSKHNHLILNDKVLYGTALISASFEYLK